MSCKVFEQSGLTDIGFALKECGATRGQLPRSTSLYFLDGWAGQGRRLSTQHNPGPQAVKYASRLPDETIETRKPPLLASNPEASPKLLSEIQSQGSDRRLFRGMGPA